MLELGNQYSDERQPEEDDNDPGYDGWAELGAEEEWGMDQETEGFWRDF
jgi:hypothetical protein